MTELCYLSDEENNIVMEYANKMAAEETKLSLFNHEDMKFTKEDINDTHNVLLRK